MNWAGLRRLGTEVAIIDGIAIVVAVVLAAVSGEFDRGTVLTILLVMGFLMMFAGAVSTGSGGFAQMPFGGAGGLNYVSVMHEEMLLQQEMQTPHGRSERSKRIGRGLTVALAGFVLSVLAVLVSYL